MASWRWNNCERRSTRLSREKRGSTAADHPACDPSRPSGVVEPEGEAGLFLLQSLGSPPLSVHANPNGVVLRAVEWRAMKSIQLTAPQRNEIQQRRRHAQDRQIYQRLS